MSYAGEREAIERFLVTEWGGETALGMDAHKLTIAAPSISLTINNGVALQGSIGRSTNRIEYVGLVQIVIYTEAGKGSAAWRTYADKLRAIFQNARIDENGRRIDAVDEEFIRFSPQSQHPYIAGTQAEASLHMATFNAPFVRYETE